MTLVADGLELLINGGSMAPFFGLSIERGQDRKKEHKH